MEKQSRHEIQSWKVDHLKMTRSRWHLIYHCVQSNIINALILIYSHHLFHNIHPGHEIRPMGALFIVFLIAILTFSIGVGSLIKIARAPHGKLYGTVILFFYLLPIPIFICAMRFMAQINHFNISK